MSSKIEYIYTDPYNIPLYKQIRVQEKDGKTFYGQRFENGEWVNGLDNVDKVLYNLPNVINAVENAKKIYWVEGEKDVETLKEKELVATTIANGVKGKLPQDLADTLDCADIIIIPDNDKVGKEFAIKVANSLTKANTIKVLDLTKKWPNLKEKGDITDVFEMINDDKLVLKGLEELEEETEFYELGEKLEKAKVKKNVERKSFFNEKIQINGQDIEINLKIPRKYKFENNSIYVQRKMKEEIVWVVWSKSLVLIKSILENIDTGEEKIELVYYKPNKKEWRTLIVDKNIINNARNIVTLGNKGLPITSNNCQSWIEYFSLLEQENYDTIPTKRTINRLGWVDNKIFIPYANEDVMLEAKENVESWLKGYKSSGTLEKWIKTMEPLRKNNIFRVVLSSAFVPPLLKHINSRTFIVNLWGPSKSGKTSALYAALSAFGEPTEIKISFFSTLVGFERLLSIHSDFVLGVNERQICQSDNLLETFTYMLNEGKGKLRR